MNRLKIRQFVALVALVALLALPLNSAVIKPVWTENVNLHTSGTVSAGASATDDIDLDTLGADATAIVIEIVFGGSVDGDVLVEIFASSNSGTDDDTLPLASFSISETNSATKRKTIVIQDVAYIAVKVTNNDSTDNVTYDSWHAWRQWSST